MASNAQKDHPSSSTPEGKPVSANDKGSKSETSFVEPQSGRQSVATELGTEFAANPSDFSAMSGLLNQLSATMATNSKSERPKDGTLSLFSFSDQNLELGFFGSSPEKPLPPPPPCVEVFSSEVDPNLRCTMESVNLDGALTLLKGRVSTQQVFALSNSDLVPGKYEGGLKLWEGSLDLVKALHAEVQNGLLSLVGKRVLELGCGHGLPGIFACLEGAGLVHFQDFNAEVLRCLTIPNVNANIEKQYSTSGERNIMPETRFFAGDWSEIHQLLAHVRNDNCQNLLESSFSEISATGYDVILMAETVYSIYSLQNLCGLIKKCIVRPNGVVYLAAKKHYFGVGGGTRQFLSVVEKDGFMIASLVAEVTNGSSNVREVWKFSIK